MTKLEHRRKENPTSSDSEKTPRSRDSPHLMGRKMRVVSSPSQSRRPSQMTPNLTMSSNGSACPRAYSVSFIPLPISDSSTVCVTFVRHDCHYRTGVLGFEVSSAAAGNTISKPALMMSGAMSGANASFRLLERSNSINPNRPEEEKDAPSQPPLTTAEMRRKSRDFNRETSFADDRNKRGSFRGMVSGLGRSSRLIRPSPSNGFPLRETTFLADVRRQSKLFGKPRVEGASWMGEKANRLRAWCGNLMANGVVLGAESMGRYYWQLVVYLLVLYTMIAVPFELVFLDRFGDDTRTRVALDAFDVVLAVLFLFDMYLNMHTTYFMGEVEITALPQISKRYLQSPSVFIDIISWVPFSTIAMASDAQRPVYVFSKLCQFVRLGKLLKSFEDLVPVSGSHFLYVTAGTLVLTHWTACLWRATTSTALTIQLGLSGYGEIGWTFDICAAEAACETPSACCQEVEHAVAAQYATSLWLGTASLFGGGQLAPVTNSDYYFSAVFCILGVCVEATVFGSIAAVVWGLASDEISYRKKVTKVCKSMRALNMPEDTLQELVLFYKMAHKRETAIKDVCEDIGFGDFAMSLQKKTKMHLFEHWVKQIPFFSTPDISSLMLEGLVARLVTKIYLPEEFIMHVGDLGDWMGFIGRGGKVAVIDPSSTREERVLLSLSEGSYVGEMSLFYGMLRTASVKAENWMRMHILRRRDFLGLQNIYPHDADILLNYVETTITKQGYKGICRTRAQERKEAAKLGNVYLSPTQQEQVRTLNVAVDPAKFIRRSSDPVPRQNPHALWLEEPQGIRPAPVKPIAMARRGSKNIE